MDLLWLDEFFPFFLLGCFWEPFCRYLSGIVYNSDGGEFHVYCFGS